MARSQVRVTCAIGASSWWEQQSEERARVVLVEQCCCWFVLRECGWFGAWCCSQFKLLFLNFFWWAPWHRSFVPWFESRSKNGFLSSSCGLVHRASKLRALFTLPPFFVLGNVEFGKYLGGVTTGSVVSSCCRRERFYTITILHITGFFALTVVIARLLFLFDSFFCLIF